MQALIPIACGLDIHKDTVVACVLSGAADQKPCQHNHSFRTFHQDLLTLRQWLLSLHVTTVAMESTGVYWRSVYDVLEGHFDLIVGNARHMKNVPGRKTDMKDSVWIATLARHGLVAKSFVPPAALRRLREMIRYRRKLIESRTAERNRLHKLLQLAGIKLSSVATDVFGQSGMLMLQALADGEQDPETLANLARRGLRKKEGELRQALQGNVQPHQRQMLSMQLKRLKAVDQDVAQLEGLIEQQVEPYLKARQLLTTIPGVNQLTATILLAEIGDDMSVFHSAGHLASWAGMCPGNNESAGHSKSTATRKGNTFLKTALVEAAHSASRTRGTFFKAKFWKLSATRGRKRALMAIGHKILRCAYVMLTREVAYQELGEAHPGLQPKENATKRMIQKLRELGYQVHPPTLPGEWKEGLH